MVLNLLEGIAKYHERIRFNAFNCLVKFSRSLTHLFFSPILSLVQNDETSVDCRDARGNIKFYIFKTFSEIVKFNNLHKHYRQIALGEILRIFSAKKLNKKTCLGTKRMNSDIAQAVMASRLKHTRQTRTGFVSPNFGSGFWADEQTPQKIPPKMKEEFISCYLLIRQ